MDTDVEGEDQLRTISPPLKHLFSLEPESHVAQADITLVEMLLPQPLAYCDDRYEQLPWLVILSYLW